MNNHPVEWKTGYEGNLWSQWSITENEKYEKYNSFEWRKCPNPIKNAVQVIGVLFIIFCFFMMLIIINVRKTEESQVSVLLRILTNYFQLLSTSMSMTLSYPDLLIKIFGPIQTIGGPSDLFLSFDWFIRDSEIKGPFESNEVFKLFLLALLPIILFAIVAFIWMIVYLIQEDIIKNIRKNLMISFITILFLLHPKLTEQSINVFRWITIDDDFKIARFDTQLECFSFSHLKYWVLLALPILIIWVIWAPVLALILLFKNIKKAKNNTIKQYFLILYQGLKPNRFYWEFVNTLRKFLIYAALLLPDTLKIMCASAVLIISGRIQLRLKPYKEESNNEVELLAINTGTIAILSTLVYSEEEGAEVFHYFAFLVMIFVNLVFLSKWVYLFWKVFEEKSKIAKVVSGDLVLWVLGGEDYYFDLLNEKERY